MDIRTEETSQGDGVAASPFSPSARAERTLWDALGTLYRERKLITVVTGAAALISVVIALLLPKWYQAEARVLTPESGSGMLGMLQQMAPSAAAFLGGGGGDYPRYLSILSSRTMKAELVHEFDLIKVYDTQDSDTPLHDALDELDGNLDFEISMDYNYLAIRALDEDPERAARMANFMVQELNVVNARLATQSARQTRMFIEQRLSRAEADLDSLRGDLQAFQEEHGVMELESQAHAFMQTMADLKTSVAQFEVRYQTLAQQYGPDNPQVQAARQAMNAARAQVHGALGGQDELLPIAMQNLPSLSRRYAELMQGQLVQAQIIETIYPLYEQALFQEQNEGVAVQIVDEAVPPVLAAKPSRRLIVIATTLTALMLACFLVLTRAWFRRDYAALSQRLKTAGYPST